MGSNQERDHPAEALSFSEPPWPEWQDMPRHAYRLPGVESFNNMHEDQQMEPPTSYLPGQFAQSDEMPPVLDQPFRPYGVPNYANSDSSFDSQGSSNISPVVLRDHTGLEMRPDLLHQELHQDGQPKRPMNSFMIFSRHRRPALQKQNPAMKTGEISGLLSDEWKSLGDVQKKTYHEHARVLKEFFHKKHPDYVFKRRGNGAGKRRKTSKSRPMRPSSRRSSASSDAISLDSSGSSVSLSPRMTSPDIGYLGSRFERYSVGSPGSAAYGNSDFQQARSSASLSWMPSPAPRSHSLSYSSDSSYEQEEQSPFGYAPPPPQPPAHYPDSYDQMAARGYYQRSQPQPQPVQHQTGFYSSFGSPFSHSTSSSRGRTTVEETSYQTSGPAEPYTFAGPSPSPQYRMPAPRQPSWSSSRSDPPQYAGQGYQSVGYSQDGYDEGRKLPIEQGREFRTYFSTVPTQYATASQASQHSAQHVNYDRPEYRPITPYQSLDAPRP